LVTFSARDRVFSTSVTHPSNSAHERVEPQIGLRVERGPSARQLSGVTVFPPRRFCHRRLRTTLTTIVVGDSWRIIPKG
jgi:hypothetical protein